MKLNLAKWNEARLKLEASLKAHKDSRRSPPGCGPDQNLRDQATALYSLRASLRGRLHCKTEEIQKDVLEGFGAEFIEQPVAA